MPKLNATLVTAANKALADLSREESAIGLRAFNDTVTIYVKVHESFAALNTALEAAKADDVKWSQAAFIKAATEAGVKITSQPTVSRIMAMASHTAQRQAAWRKANPTARFNEYVAYLGKLNRNVIKPDGTLTEAGQEEKARQDEAAEKNAKARRSVTLVDFDMSGLHAAKATKATKLDTLLRLKADLEVQIADLVAEIGKEKADAIAEAVRKAERDAVKAAKAS